MRYLVGIPFVNRLDLLHLAVNSIELYWKHTFIIDNSPGRVLRKNSKLPALVQVYEPPVPLTFTQSMNWMQRIAAEKKCDVLMFMHSDARAEPGTPEKFLSKVEALHREGIKWGVAFTQYDTLCAFNMEATRAIGEWDTNFPHYFADNDYYRRLRLGGFELVNTNLPVHHERSSTIKSDPYRKLINKIVNPLYKSLYIKKWGGKSKEETFTIPFNLEN